MYVCNCRGITDKQIREAVRAGACNRQALSLCLDVGTGCGKCSEQLEDLLESGARSDPLSRPDHAVTTYRPAAAACAV